MTEPQTVQDDQEKIGGGFGAPGEDYARGEDHPIAEKSEPIVVTEVYYPIPDALGRPPFDPENHYLVYRGDEHVGYAKVKYLTRVDLALNAIMDVTLDEPYQRGTRIRVPYLDSFRTTPEEIESPVEKHVCPEYVREPASKFKQATCFAIAVAATLTAIVVTFLLILMPNLRPELWFVVLGGAIGAACALEELR